MASKADSSARMQDLVDKAIAAVCASVPKANLKPFPVQFEWTRKKNVVGTFSQITSLRLGERYTIGINRAAWPTLTDDDKELVLLHEACHAVVAYYGIGDPTNGHGRSWTLLMKACGADPRVAFVEGT